MAVLAHQLRSSNPEMGRMAPPSEQSLAELSQNCKYLLSAYPPEDRSAYGAVLELSIKTLIIKKNALDEKLIWLINKHQMYLNFSGMYF